MRGVPASPSFAFLLVSAVSVASGARQPPLGRPLLAFSSHSRRETRSFRIPAAAPSVVRFALPGGGGGGSDDRPWTDDDDWEELSSFPRPRRARPAEDEGLYRSLRARADELGVAGAGAGVTDSPDAAGDGADAARRTPAWSLEALALAVSVFFAATAALTGGALFAQPPPPASSLSGGAPAAPRVADAGALLREDFDREGTSVYFGPSDGGMERGGSD